MQVADGVSDQLTALRQGLDVLREHAFGTRDQLIADLGALFQGAKSVHLDGGKMT